MSLQTGQRLLSHCITKTSPCNEHPLKPHFYIVNWGLQGIYLNAKVSQPFTICFSSVWSMRGYFNDHILCSCAMSNDLPKIGLGHAFYVIMTYVFSNDLRLRYGFLSRFKNKRCDVIARCHN